MTWNIVHLNDVRPTPWRNGGGTTRELLAWPSSADWQWRASVAEIVRPGPFSSLPGVQRYFAVLGGDGVCLTVDGYLHMLTTSDQPLAFDGAAVTICDLLGSATQDFNLMVQGGLAVRMLRVDGNCEVLTNAPKIIAAYAHKQGATVQIGSEKHELSPYSFGWMQVGENTAIHVQASHALLMEMDI